jgi:hypothetical protein
MKNANTIAAASVCITDAFTHTPGTDAPEWSPMTDACVDDRFPFAGPYLKDFIAHTCSCKRT